MSVAALLLFIRALGLTLPLWFVAGWAGAEAILWFIVADVPISWIAVRSGTRAGLLAALVAAGAAVAGGLATWFWAAHDPKGAAAAIGSLPAISDGLIREAAAAWQDAGWRGMLAFSFQGVPYKLFALAAGTQGSSLPLFLLATFFARLPRFALAALISGSIGKQLGRWLSMRARLVLLMLFWVLFYAWYFANTPS